MRLFLGLSIPPHIQEQLQNQLTQVRQQVSASSWVPAQNYHITLLFLGEMSNQEVANMEPLLENVSRKTPPFSLYLKQWGAFPGMQNAKIFWAGVKGDIQALQWLVKNLQNALSQVLSIRAERHYHPHVTLSRKLKLPEVPKNLNDRYPLQSDEWTVREFTLFISHNTSKGVHYEAWENFPLRKKNILHM